MQERGQLMVHSSTSLPYMWYTYISRKSLTCTLCEICSHTQCLSHAILVWYFTAVDSSVHRWQTVTLAGSAVQTNQWSASVSIVWLTSTINGDHCSIRVEPLPSSSACTSTAGSSVSCTEQSTSITHTNTLQEHNAVVGDRLAIEGHTWNREDMRIGY